jgi:hypothetical protein
MEEAAKSHKGWDEMMTDRHEVGLPLLQAQESYFVFVAQCLDYVRYEAELLVGRTPSHVYEAPPKMSRPLLRS